MLRTIAEKDNGAVAQLIRSSLKEYHLDKPGTAYCDPQLVHLSHYYQNQERANYYVIEEKGQILACGGYAGITPTTAELQKLYVAQGYRGKGYSSQLLNHIFDTAKKDGYDALYLETTKALEAAVSVYQHYGFKRLDTPIANGDGHTAMEIWMLKAL